MHWTWTPILCLLLTGCLSLPPATPVPPDFSPITSAEVPELARNGNGQVTFVNIWATWCPPCKEELPDLLRLERDYKNQGVKLVLVSADFESQHQAAREFLSQIGVTFPTYYKNESDNEFISGIYKEWSGALPVTLLYDSSGQVRHFWYSQDVYANFERVLLAIFPEIQRRKNE